MECRLRLFIVMKKASKVILIFLYIACIITIICGLIIYSIHRFVFNGIFVKYLALEPVYYYYEPLVDDYISLLKSDRPATALSCIDPALLQYYASIYRLNTDIIKTLDDAYVENKYHNTESWYIHHTIEWNPDVYQDVWDKLSIDADRGIDLYITFHQDNNTDSVYIFEVIQRDGSWYILSVTPE